MSESRNGESRSYSSYTPSYSSYGGESKRGGESRYSYFSAQRNEFMGRIRCKTGSINNDIGDDRRNVMKELKKRIRKNRR